MGKQKYYVVWKGFKPGVYATWEEAKAEILHFANPVYKAFLSKEEAEKAFADDYKCHVNLSAKDVCIEKTIDKEAWVVDASCLGNPGQTEYRGIDLQSQNEILHFGPFWGTNNIGEFLAIVHALALMEQQQIKKTIYSDSAIAIKWVKKGKCQTKLAYGQDTAQAFQYIQRAEKWLSTNPFRVPIKKWQTNIWGEIIADFGRKKNKKK